MNYNFYINKHKATLFYDDNCESVIIGIANEVFEISSHYIFEILNNIFQPNGYYSEWGNSIMFLDENNKIYMLFYQIDESKILELLLSKKELFVLHKMILFIEKQNDY